MKPKLHFQCGYWYCTLGRPKQPYWYVGRGRSLLEAWETYEQAQRCYWMMSIA